MSHVCVCVLPSCGLSRGVAPPVTSVARAFQNGSRLPEQASKHESKAEKMLNGAAVAFDIEEGVVRLPSLAHVCVASSFTWLAHAGPPHLNTRYCLANRVLVCFWATHPTTRVINFIRHTSGGRQSVAPRSGGEFHRDPPWLEGRQEEQKGQVTILLLY
jgi:hypothetical protein